MQRLTRRGVIFCLGMLGAGLLSAIFARTIAQPAAADETAVLAADKALGEAMRAGDKSAARRLLGLSFSYTDEDGKLHERKEFLADLQRLAAAAPTGITVKIYGLVAMVTGYRKSVEGSDTFFLDIWAKEKRAWRALTMQDVVLAAADTRLAGPEVSPEALAMQKAVAKFFDCKNPCETIPYRVRSPAEQDILTAFQAIEKATFTRDPDHYSRYLADEFVHYESGIPPVAKADRVARIEDAKKNDSPAILLAIQSMRLWVYGDGAAMVSTSGVPDDTEPLLRVARVWARRNGKWQMVISVQTDVKESESK